MRGIPEMGNSKVNIISLELTEYYFPSFIGGRTDCCCYYVPVDGARTEPESNLFIHSIPLVRVG
jgi:hypothetical protein